MGCPWGVHSIHTVYRADSSLQVLARSRPESPSMRIYGRTRGPLVGTLTESHFRSRAWTSCTLSLPICTEGQTDPGTNNRYLRSALNIKPSFGLHTRGLPRHPDRPLPSLHSWPHPALRVSPSCLPPNTHLLSWLGDQSSAAERPSPPPRLGGSQAHPDLTQGRLASRHPRRACSEATALTCRTGLW